MPCLQQVRIAMRSLGPRCVENFAALHCIAKLSSAMHCWDTLTRLWRRTWQHMLRMLPLWPVLRSSLQGSFNYVGALMVAQLGGYV